MVARGRASSPTDADAADPATLAFIYGGTGIAEFMQITHADIVMSDNDNLIADIEVTITVPCTRITF